MDNLDREKLIKYQQKYENSNQDYNLSLLSKTGIKWLEILENEFDKRFVDLNFFLNNLNENSKENNDENCPINQAKNTLNEISSIFAQLAHKCLVVFDNNTKLEKDLYKNKQILKLVQSECKLLETKLNDNSQTIKNNDILSPKQNLSLNSIRLNNTNKVMSLSSVTRSNSLLNIRCNYPQLNDNSFSEIYAEEEIKNLREENHSLKKYLISIKSELFGSRLAAKYLNKELSGRIQQIQILSKSDLTKVDQSRLWNQIETEIHLSRHKTVIKACRGRGQIVFGQKPNLPEICDFHSVKKNHGICEIRKVVIEKKINEGLGISITGGNEYGIPILVSEIHRNTPASRCGKLYIGDSILSVNNIDLSNVKHSEAAKILMNQSDYCELECVFVLPDYDENNDKNSDQDVCSSKYCYFDSRVTYNNKDLNNLHSNQNEKINEFNKLISNDSEEDEEDNISSITDTLGSPSKLYPGGAKPLFARTLIQKELDESLNKNFDESEYSTVKLQTIDGKNCQIFYKNKSTIIN